MAERILAMEFFFWRSLTRKLHLPIVDVAIDDLEVVVGLLLLPAAWQDPAQAKIDSVCLQAFSVSSCEVSRQSLCCSLFNHQHQQR